MPNYHLKRTHDGKGLLLRSNSYLAKWLPRWLFTVESARIERDTTSYVIARFA